MFHKRGGTLLKLTAFRLSQQSLERLDEIVATYKQFSATRMFRPESNRSTVLRSMIDDEFTKVMASKTPPAPAAEKPKTKTPRPQKKGQKK